MAWQWCLPACVTSGIEARFPSLLPSWITHMKILVIGSGGREHALAWKLAQSPRVTEVLVAPGNAGTATEAGCRNVPVKVTDLDGLLALVQAEGVELTVVGPEVPLVAGVVDRFRAAGHRIFGPTAAAAQLEGSKAYAKDFLARHNIPTAFYAVHTEVDAALAYIRDKGAPIVVKADGIAAGKGVVVAETLTEAHEAIDACFDGAFGSAGAEVVVEECLIGEEASFFAICDGVNAVPLATAQDHKRVGDGDTGPNTGGMGAYSPAPVMTEDLVELVEAAIDARLDSVQAQWDPRPSLGVVMAASPYPETPITGDVIRGLDQVPATAKVFHAGTTLDAQGQVLSAGGRVLCVAALGDSVGDAQANAYAGVAKISWEHEFHRNDIGWRAIARENA
jgi:phosphoribosylamine--glycine ligase